MLCPVPIIWYRHDRRLQVTTAQAENPLEAFQWKPQPQAEALVTGLAERFLAANDFARDLQRRLDEQAGVRLVDLIDSVHVPDSRSVRDDLSRAGFINRPVA